jgi:hypothetical protein
MVRPYPSLDIPKGNRGTIIRAETGDGLTGHTDSMDCRVSGVLRRDCTCRNYCAHAQLRHYQRATPPQRLLWRFHPDSPPHCRLGRYHLGNPGGAGRLCQEPNTGVFDSTCAFYVFSHPTSLPRAYNWSLPDHERVMADVARDLDQGSEGHVRFRRSVGRMVH